MRLIVVVSALIVMVPMYCIGFIWSFVKGGFTAGFDHAEEIANNIHKEVKQNEKR